MAAVRWASTRLCRVDREDLYREEVEAVDFPVSSFAHLVVQIADGALVTFVERQPQESAELEVRVDYGHASFGAI